MARVRHMLPLLALLTLTSTVAAAKGLVADAPDPDAILGGAVVGPCGWPNVVSVAGSCSGTLIHPRIVLYAAHCGDEVPWIRFTDAIESAERREVVPERCEIHPVGEFGFGTDFAYCLLPEAITDVPITPPLAACEADEVLKVGQPVTLIGFGQSDDPDPELFYGIKRFVDTEITGFSWDEVFVGDTEHGACYGDSGGPAAVRLADGSWRVFGVTSWGQPGCGAGNYFSLVHNGIDWIEGASGIDVTPCTDSFGAWDPSPACTGFASGDPGAASGAWDTCTFAPTSAASATCGPAFDPAPDTTPPVVVISDPADGSHVNGVGGKKVAVVITVDASDVGWGTESVTLRILDGAGDKELFTLEDPAAPFVFPSLDFSTGLWTLEAIGVDRAGNHSEPARIVFGVNSVPPTIPEETTGGASESDTDASDASTDDASGSGEGSTDGGATSGGAAEEGEGCGCRSSGPGGAGSLALGVAMLGFARRRRRALVAALAAVPAGCGDDGVSVSASASATSGESTSGGESTTSGATAVTDTTATDASTATTTGEPEPACGNGLIDGDELCDDGNTIDGDGCNADCRPSGEVVWEAPLAGVDQINALAVDGAGNVIVAGYVDDDGLDAWIGAFTPDGEPLWSDVYDGAAGLDDFYRDVAVVDGLIVAAGGGDRDDATIRTLIARFDGDGARLSAIAVSEDPMIPEVATDLVVTDAGQAIAVIASGKEGVASLAAFDEDGARAWSLPISAQTRSGGVVRTADGATLAAFREIVDAGRADVLVLKVSDAGEVLWKKAHGDPLTEYYVSDVAVAPSGDLVVCGSVLRASALDTALFGLTATGELRWKTRPGLPGPGWDECAAALVDADERVVFSGGGFYKEGVDMWFGRLASDGAALWTDVHGADGPYYDYGGALVLLGDGGVVVGGTLNVDGAPNAALVRLSP